MKTFEHEPIRGLPEKLPEGEGILWQGTPNTRFLAVHVFRIRWVAGLFALFLAIGLAVAISEGSPIGAALLRVLVVLPIPLAGLAILVAMAWAHARTTVYTLTNRRWVLRYGVALPMMVNLPFKAVVSAEFKERGGDGEGDLPIRMRGGTGPSYLHLWPHARPGRITHPEPMLRGIKDVKDVARVFAETLLEFREAHDAEGCEPEDANPTSNGVHGPSRSEMEVRA